MMYYKIIILLALFAPVRVFSADKNFFVPVDKFAGLDAKNDINLSKIGKNFSQNFKFVSVHFREDKSEIRLIYGNAAAIEGLNSGNAKYKDGSIFYKVIYDTEHDTAFESSVIPKPEPKLKQLMVYDQKKYKKYGGWTYAVFNVDGKTLPGDPDATNSTCFACHQIVANRNYVFSLPMFGIAADSKSLETKQNHENAKIFRNDVEKELFSFETKEAGAVDANVKMYIHSDSPKFEVMTGKMMSEKFLGYLAEVRSFLTKQTLKSGRPALAIANSSSELVFSFAYVDTDAKSICGEKKRLVRSGLVNYLNRPNHKNVFLENLSCHD